jgi:glycerol-3-phosphate O-acyltransferase
MDYMLREFHPEFDKDVVFVPVGINYDRVVEDRSLIRRLDPNAKRRNQWYVIKTTLAFATKMLLLSRKLRWRRFGYASVNFGRPISVKQYCEANEVKFDEADSTHRFEQVKKLADTIMGHIAAVIPILPIALISEVLLENKNIWKSELDLKSQALQKIELLRKKGAPIDISSGASEGVLNNALTMLVGRRLVDVEENLIRPKEEALVLLEYYANSIKQWK